MEERGQSRVERTAFYTSCWTALALVVIGFGCLCSAAQEQRLSQYIHRAWLLRDGHFNGVPVCIAQTADGYIWVGTDSGLYRFDGSRFELWSSPDGMKLPSNLIRALLAARDGSLWIGTAGGLAHFFDHRLFVYPNFRDPIAALLEDQTGNTWMSRSAANGALQSPICQALPTRIHCFNESDGVTTKSCCAAWLAQDKEGYLWAVTEGPLVRWRSGHSEREYLPKSWARTRGIETADSVTAMPDGAVLVCNTNPGRYGGLQRLSKEDWEPVKVTGFDGSKIRAFRAFRDADGAIWVGTIDEGIYRISGNQYEKFGSKDGLSHDFVNAFYQDREGGVWVATSGGLDYFHTRKLAIFTKREGLAFDIVDGITAAGDSSVWVNSGNTLDLVKNGHIDIIRTHHGLPGPTAMFVDSSGRLWSGIDNDLYRFDHGEFHRVLRESGGSTRFIVGITEDSAHDIWAEVSGSNRELIRIHDLRVVEEYPEALVPSARALASAPDGVLWLGLRNGDLARFDHGHAKVFTSPGGQKSFVFQVVVNPDGTVFATTSAGLIGWKSGVSHLLSSRNGLPCDTVAGAAWDYGALWLDTGCGLARISQKDVDRWWRDDTVIVTSKMLDALDGIESDLQPDFNPMVRTADGRLWTASRSDVEEIDPARLPQNDLPPPVQIERIVVDHKAHQPDAQLALPPKVRDLEVDYAALSFINPPKIRFRYQLEGRDKGWQDAGTRREAFYTDLPPGPYRFRVIACNNDGVWNEAGASLNFSVAPEWFQTSWFRVLAVVVSLTLMFVLYQFRLRQLRHQFDLALEARVNERTRIARELHDTLLQSLHGLMFAVQAARNIFHKRPEEALLALDSAIEGTEQAIGESQDAIEDLRSSATPGGDLAELVKTIGEVLMASSCSDKDRPAFGFTVEGEPRVLTPAIQDEAYRIVREVLRNAFRHSQAHRIEAEILYADDQLRLRVRDDGKGMDPQVLDQGKRQGHWGLPGIRERTEKLGGKLDIWSEVGAGTEIQLNIPASLAYPKASRRSSLTIFERASRNVKRS